MTDLHDLLDRASDRIGSPHLGHRALVAARRRRSRSRTVAVALLASAAVVVAAVISVELADDASRVDQPPVVTSSSGPPTVRAVAPAITPSRIQPIWDPRGVEGLPVTDLGVPRVMESLAPGVVTRPVAVLDDGRRTLLVSGDGTVDDLQLPRGVGPWRDVSLSPDGELLAVAGIGGFYWRTLGETWRHIAVEGDRSFGDGAEITWAPDSRSVVVRSYDTAQQIDLVTGDERRLPMLSDYESWAFAPDGAVVTTSPAVRLWQRESLLSETSLGPLESVQRPVVDERSIAAARGNTSWGEERSRDDNDGLIVVDRETLETRSFLPVVDHASYYVDGGALTPVAWIDDDVLAFTVHPMDAAKAYLVTWNVETGVLSRVSCWDSSFSAVFAVGVLGE